MVPANQPQKYQWPKGYVGKSWVSRQEMLLFPVDSHIMKDNYVPSQETGEQELHFFLFVLTLLQAYLLPGINLYTLSMK